MVIEAIWNGLQRLGVGKGAQILEPAMGVGPFLRADAGDPCRAATGPASSWIPSRPASRRSSIPDSTIFAKGFEETPLPDNYFDAVVGNVPFGDYAVHDPAMKPQLTRAIHDYFFAKSLEKLRPGGVMALITSRYTMDKQDDTIRRHLAEQRRSAGRDPPAEHRVQGQCRNGSHDRHSVPAQARARSAARGPCLAQA